MSSKESTITSSDEETDDNAVVSKLLKDVTLMMTELQAEPKPAFEKMRPGVKELLGRETLSLQAACWNPLSPIKNRRLAFVASSTDPEKNEMLRTVTKPGRVATKSPRQSQVALGSVQRNTRRNTQELLTGDRNVQKSMTVASMLGST